MTANSSAWPNFSRMGACAIFLLLATLSGVRADLYVSPAGLDGNDGSEAKPFLTLERARDAVRDLRRAGKIPAGGMTVWLRGGDYPRTNSLALTAADSGTPEGPIVWRGFGNERARLLGGRKLDAFQAVTNTDVLNRLPAEARRHVVELPVRDLPPGDSAEMTSRGFSRPTTPAHHELFFGGRPMTLARWPNEGEWTKIAGFPENSGTGDDHGGSIGELTGGFLYDGDRPKRWRNSGNLWVHGYWAWDWANSYERVAELDTERRMIRTAPPYGLYGFRKGQRFYFLNVLEELDQPGEWFFDRERGTIYFWPPEGEPRETILSISREPLVKLEGASHLALRGLVLEATRGNAIEMRGGAGNLVAGCLIRNIGNNAVVISGGTGHGVRSCGILDTGDGGVIMTGGDRQTLVPGGHFTENSHFQRQGRWSKCYVPAVLLNGVGQRVSHNSIHDHPHAAVIFSGNDHTIEFNDIHHIALETGDVGAIYTGRDFSFRGNRILHNYVHETGGVGMGSMGVYMDDCVSGAGVFGNVFYKVRLAMFIGGGRDHRVENNIFVDCDPAVQADGRGLDRAPVWRKMVDEFMRRQLAAVPAALYRGRYPAMKSLDAYYGPPGGPAIVGEDFKGIPPEGNVIVRNVAVGKWLVTGWHAKPEMLDLRDNWVTAEPGAVGSAREGFALPKDSPAWRLGFKPIPFDRIGLQPDDDRRHLRQLEDR